MDTTEKFSTKLNKKVLHQLKAHAERSSQTISFIVSQALAEYFERSAVRPVFRSAVDEVIRENEELLSELAK